MNYVIEYYPLKKYIYSKFTGETGFRVAYKSSLEAKKLAQECNCHHFLIDMTETIVKYSISEAMEFVVGLSELEFTQDDIVAFIISRDKRKYKFAESIAVDRGWHIKHFSNRADAEEWLASFPPI